MSQAAPLVAVVTPAYNAAAFLDETMACVQAQTYPNLVHVVVDNASSDGTPDIIARRQSGRAPVLASRNPTTLPLQENWNAAVARAPAEAKYVRILCADDTMTPDAVEKMTTLAERHPGVGVVGCLHHRNGPTEPAGWPTDREAFAGREALARILLGQCMIIATHTLMRRSDIDPAEPLFRQGLVASDTQTCLRLLTRSDWGFVHEDLALTRVHPGSQTSALLTSTEIQFFDWLMLLKEFGPAAFGPEEFATVIERFRRHYARRMIRWRVAGRSETYAKHKSALDAAGEPPSLARDVAALADWVACKLGLNVQWSGYPF